MKILLDECVTKHLKPFLIGHEVATVREMKWSGIKNGELMRRCVESQFEILLTIDKNLKNQQNFEKYPLSIVVFNSVTSKIEELKEFIPLFQMKINSFEKHRAYVLEKS
ncbi:MAG: DUF5615 family PIN-like protein [Chitinophagaceae bacterium]|nr:DUF5615 family PIN-like protein [Chitinophagaceae bacterium]